MTRILGIDYGSTRLGLAMSDEDGILASPLPVRTRKTLADDLDFITRLVNKNMVGTIVVGLPLNMNGSHGQMAQAVMAFVEHLGEKCDVPIDTFDERLTTSEAERVLVQADVSRKRRRPLRDGLAATLILQGYLDTQRLRVEHNENHEGHKR